MHEQPSAEQPDAEMIKNEAGESPARDGPHIHVASLSDYNAGILYGTWLDATADPTAMHARIEAMLPSRRLRGSRALPPRSGPSMTARTSAL